MSEGEYQKANPSAPRIVKILEGILNISWRIPTRWLLNSFRILQEFSCCQLLWQNYDYFIFLGSFLIFIRSKLCQWSRRQRISSRFPCGILTWVVGITLKKPAGFLYIFFTSFFSQGSTWIRKFCWWKYVHSWKDNHQKLYYRCKLQDQRKSSIDQLCHNE